MGSEATINDNDSNVVIVLLWICLFCSLIVYAWFKFYFLLLLGMIMYDNELQTK